MHNYMPKKGKHGPDMMMCPSTVKVSL